MNTLITILLVLFSIPFSIMYASIFEWVLHKYVMHAKPFGFNYAFNGHVREHHTIFRSGELYVLQNHSPEKQKTHRKTIPMAWWNWIVLLVIANSPVAVICLIISVWWPLIVTTSVFFVYYCTYEYFHWCMHDPKGHWFENKWWFVWINNHHNIHHAKMGKNFNVVLPFADWLFRTLVR